LTFYAARLCTQWESELQLLLCISIAQQGTVEQQPDAQAAQRGAVTSIGRPPEVHVPDLRLFVALPQRDGAIGEQRVVRGPRKKHNWKS
jgi:hypothetical protein